MQQCGHWRLGFAGFGHVNRALARLLITRRDELLSRAGLSFSVTLVSSARRGAWVDASGIDLEHALEHGWSSPDPLLDRIPTAPIDLLFEGTPLDPQRGEPATTHARAALERGVSVVSANKGPVAFAARQLVAIAGRTGAGFRYESAVADCLPIFDLVEVALPVGRVTAFQGVLNSTSNFVLQAVVRGRTEQEAVREARRLGVAEADPSHDLDGWDQAVKAVILANLLMGRDLRPADVERVPFAAIDPQWVRAEERSGRSVRLVAAGGPKGPVRTGPVSLESGSFLGTLGAGSIGILEPRVEQTAYGMLSDLVAIHQGRRILPAPYPTAP
jgi:homoserine dehydrogenase